MSKKKVIPSQRHADPTNPLDTPLTLPPHSKRAELFLAEKFSEHFFCSQCSEADIALNVFNFAIFSLGIMVDFGLHIRSELGL